MRHLIKEWKKIAGDIKNSYLYLFLDFDGTLTPIRKDPQKVKLGREIYSVLEKIAGMDNVAVAIISGRKLSEIKRMAGLKGMIYVGNHGLEAAGPGILFKHPSARKAQKTMKAIRQKLKRSLGPFKGVIVEDKGLTLSIHYRMADKAKIKKITQIFKAVTEPYRKGGKIRITGGKKVWEVRPPVVWDKGKIVDKLLNGKKQRIKRKVLPVYLGDDRTDEDAFKQLKGLGYTVKITKNPYEASMASYYLGNIHEVSMFLKNLYSLRKKG